MISGILHVLKVDCRWQDWPADYGPHTTHFLSAGVLAALLAFWL